MQSPERSDRYNLSQTGFINALKGTNLEHPNPDPLFGVDSDVGRNGILFAAKDPSVNQVMKYKDNLYFIALSTFNEDPAPAPQKISVPGYDGTANAGTFSPNGKSAAFLQRKDPNNAYARASIFIIENLNKSDHFTEVMTSTSTSVWDLQPDSLAFNTGSRELYITAESRGAKLLFKIPIISPTAGSTTIAVPTPLTANGVISTFHILSPTRLLCTLSTLTTSSIFAIIDPSSSESTAYIFSHKYKTPNFAHRAPEVSVINFQGAGGGGGAGSYEVQAFVVKPSDFVEEEDQTYPMLLWIHGGPVSSWTDSWSYRWNAALFAEQGYIVIMPNITGSIGFGQRFIEDISGEWGGRPYADLVNCFEYVKETMPFVDTERAVAMGASYGGYMINWYGLPPTPAVLTLAQSHNIK